MKSMNIAASGELIPASTHRNVAALDSTDFADVGRSRHYHCRQP